MSPDAAVQLLVLSAAGFALAWLLSSRLPLLIVTFVAVAWPIAPRGLQGPNLAVFTPGHGLHVSDLLTPVLLVLAAAHALQLAGARAGAAPESRQPVSVIDLREPAEKYSRAP